MKSIYSEENIEQNLFSHSPKRPGKHPIIVICAATDGQLMLPSLLAHLPATSGYSFVVQQQIVAGDEELTPELLQTHTELPIVPVTDNLPIAPNTIYITEANGYTSLAEGRFVLAPRSRNKTGVGPGQFFMMKLARKCRSLSGAILLGDTACQFTEGIKYIKAEGGIVVAHNALGQLKEEKDTAQLEQPDTYFLPENLEVLLGRLFSEPHFLLLQKVDEPDEAAIKNILGLIYSQKGIDLSLNKPEIINRRIIRRMRLKEVMTSSDYFELLTGSVTELNTLCNELSLNNSCFFQDASVYQALSNHVFPKILKNRKEKSPIRIWCPACYTGEEAYSIAICLLEYLKANELSVEIQIFATDTNKEAVRKAHAGYYNNSALQNISQPRLATYFEKAGDRYQVAIAVRELCVFATHHLQKDPPFPRLDIISYQNEQVTLDTSYQHKILQSFHYGLTASGYLVLSKSETPGNDKFFTQISKDQRIYSRTAGSISNIGYSFRSPLLKNDSGSTSLIDKAFQEQNELAAIEKASEKLLLSRYVPASIVIDSRFQIIRFHGPIYKYLQPSSGKASLNVLNMLQEDLALELHQMVQQVTQTGKPVRKENVVLSATYDGDTKASIEIAPIRTVDITPFYLVIFEEKTRFSYVEEEPAQVGSNIQRVRLLEQELKESREQLRSLSEDFKNIREDLQASAEEATANNEELQSINEELKIEKEELQQAIKKIFTVNEDLATQNTMLAEAAEYSANIIEAIQEPLVLLNANLSIYIANKAFYTAFKLTPADIEGQFFYEIANNRWNVPELLSKLGEVVALKKKSRISFEVPFPEDRILSFNAVLLEGNSKKHYSHIMLTIRDITQHLQAREAKEWLAAVVSASNEGIISFTTNRTVISWNKAAEEIFGYKEAEIVCKSLSRLVKQGDKVAQHRMIERVMKGETVQQEEIECIHKNGHRIYVSISMASMKDLKGNTKGLMALVQDITERKLAEAALVESEERYRPIVSQSAVGIIRADFTGKLLFVNDKFCEMLNYTTEELREKTIWDLCYSGHYEETKKRLNRLQVEGISFEYEKQLIRKNDTPLWTNINLSAIKSAEGKPLSLTAVIIDISKSKEAEEALQKTKEGLQVALEAANMGIWEMDIASGEATYHSLRNDQIFGYSNWLPKWTIGMARLHVLEEDKLIFDEAVTNMVSTGKLQMEVRVKWPDGSIHWINKVGRLFYDKAGTPQRAAGVAMDITDRKLQEQRKEEFISIASHELKTPVTSIKAYAQILQEQFLENNDKVSANMLGKLDKQVDKLAGLIRDLLDTARLTDGQMVLQPAIFDINSLIKEVVDDMQPAAIHHQIVKELRPVPPVEADKERIRQVLVNLMSNAIKYSPTANKVIVRTSRDANSLRVSVQDFGIGMSIGAQEKIFDRYFRVNSNKMKAFPGLGLGLFISSEIIKKHKGTIGVASEENEGSEFYFSLPLST